MEAQEESKIENASSFDERIALMHEAIRSEKAESKAADSKAEAVPTESTEATPTAEPTAAPEPESPPPDLDKIRAERRAALDRLTQSERNADAKRRERVQQRPTPPPQTSDELEQMRAQLKALESAFSDETALLMAARQRGMNPMKFGELLKETITNPDFIAEQKLKSYEVKLAEVEKRVDQKVAERLAEIERQNQARIDEEAERNAAKQLVELTNSSARVAPLSAAFLAKHGHEAFVTFATNVASALPPGVGLERVHDAIEVSLEHLQLTATPTATPATSKPKPPDAAAKAKQVTNQLASSRSTVEDTEVDWASLPYEERLRRLR